MLFYPYSIEKDARNHKQLLVTDYSNRALRSINLSTGELGTVLNLGLNYPRGLTWKGNKLLIANYGFISQVSWLRNGSAIAITLVGSTSLGNADGTFQDSKFEYLHELADVGDNFLLATEHAYNILRLIDFNDQVVGPVCFNGENPCNSE